VGRPRTRCLVEEAWELPVRLLTRFPPGQTVSSPWGAPHTLQHAATPDATLVSLEPFPHVFCGRPTPTPKLYVRCPRCQARRCSLFLVAGELGCRGCFKLGYHSQSHGRWDLPLFERVKTRVVELTSRPGPKGRCYQVWAKRLRRVETQAYAFLKAWERKYGDLRRSRLKGGA